MKLPEIKREVLRTFLILITLGLVFLRFGYFPYKQKLKEKKELYAELTEAYLNKKNLLTKKKALKTFEVRSEEGEKPEFLTLLYPKEEDPFLLQIKLVKEIKDIAEKSKLQIKSVDMLSFPAGTKRLVEIPFDIKARGKTKDVINFLEKVVDYFYKNKKFFKVSELILYESRGELDLTLKISVFKSEV